jgi:hypothetical protein
MKVTTTSFSERILQPASAKGYYNQLQQKVTTTIFGEKILQPASMKLVVVRLQ